jgi:c-di-GMP-related signal transduction protein
MDVVKIDVMRLDSAALARLVQDLRLWPVRLLAEKVDNVSQAKQCVLVGMEWLQEFMYGPPACLAA